ncbi:hypothetical protein O181_002285 [Austropuccinia psidii MF-1]|uniref:Uncharacterized protein n=1 Tax=Austropuccinia psidii MF-1 TaxID=1389203 RepID=A0A9Q3BCR0_9BASI|nr:hypothetical protein [Austropuccinia psidii MF-1]
MKYLSSVTCNLSKMMTSNHSLSHSTSRRRGKKPTAQSEAWKKDHSQGETCSYDNLSLHPTANLQYRSPRTTKEFNLKYFQLTGSLLSDEYQKPITTITTLKKIQHKSNSIDKSETNKASEDRSRNNIFNSSSNTADEPISKASIPNNFKNLRSGLYYNGRTSKVNEAPILNDNLVSVQKNIITNKNPINNKNPMISNFSIPLSFNQPEMSTNESYNNGEQKVKLNNSCTGATINKIEFETIDATDAENKEKRILNKIKTYIKRKRNDQPITTEIQISCALLNIIRNIHNERDLYYYLNSKKPYNILTVQIESAPIQQSFHRNKLNKNKLKDLRKFNDSNNKK